MISLKLTFDKDELERDATAFVRLYKMKDGPVFAHFEFPNNFARLGDEQALYDQYANPEKLPEWTKRLTEEDRENIHSGFLLMMQANDGNLTPEFETAMKEHYGATDAN